MGTSSTKTTLLITAATVTIPAPFDVKPLHVVELPGKREAHIYETKVEVGVYRAGQHETETRDGWRIVVFRKNGAPDDRASSAMAGFRSRNHQSEFTDALDVQLALRQLAAYYAPKTRTVVENTDHDDD